MDRWSWQQCQCVDGFTGRFCEKCKLRPPAAPPSRFPPEPLEVRCYQSLAFLSGSPPVWGGSKVTVASPKPGVRCS